MADYYIHGETGNDSTGTGTSANPWATYAALPADASLTAGTRIFRAGKIRRSARGGTNPFANLTEVSFLQWPGQTTVDERGDVIPTWSGAGSIWTASTTNCVSVVENWDANVNGNGHHYGHYAHVAAGSVAGTAKSFNRAAGTLTINTGGINPNVGNVVAICEGGYAGGLVLTNATRCVVEVGYVSLHCDPRAGQGYGVLVYGTGNVVRPASGAGIIRDCGYHSYGAVGSGAGNVNVDNTCSGLTFQGLFGAAAGAQAGNAGSAGSVGADTSTYGAGTTTVWYSVDTNITGGRETNCRHEIYSALSTAGTPLDTARSVGGPYAHGSGTNIVVYDVERRNITIQYYYNASGLMPCAANAITPSNGWDYRTFGARFIDTNIIGAASISAQGSTVGANFAWARVRTDSSNYPNAVGTGWLGAMYLPNPSGICIFLMDSCGWVGDISSPASGTRSPAAIRVSGNASNGYDLRELNCTFVETSNGAGAVGFKGFHSVQNAAGARRRQRGTVFCYQFQHATHNFHDFSDTGTAVVDYAGGYYINHSFVVATFSNKTGATSQANWTSTVDSTGVYRNSVGTSPVLSTVTFEPRPGDDLRSRHVAASIKTLVGLNGRPYSGLYGAWQDGGSPSGRVSRGSSRSGSARLWRM